MARKTTSALALTAPLSANIDLSLTRAQQDALVLNQVRIQQEEAVCKAALHQVKETLDSQIAGFTARKDSLIADRDALQVKIDADLKDFVESHALSTHYATVAQALIGAGHKAEPSTTFDSLRRPTPSQLKEKDHPYVCDGYHIDIQARLSIDGAANRGSYYGNSLVTERTVYVNNSINQRLEIRDALNTDIASLDAQILSLRTKRDSLWSMEDQMKAQLALKSINADPSQSAALSETTAFLLSKLGISSGGTEATKPVASTSKRVR